MTTPLPVDLVDLSHYQNVTQKYIDDLKKAGVKGVYYKSSEGNGMSWASHYNKVRAYCKKAGMPFGGYHYGHPHPNLADAVDEARHFLSIIKPVPGDLIPMLDLEETHGYNKTVLTNWVQAFVDTVKKAGFETILYTPFDLNRTMGLKLWVARYHNGNAAPRIPSPWKNFSVRQFSDGVYGSPKSVAGKNIDLNTLKGNDGTTLKSLTIQPKVAPKPPKPARTVYFEGNITTSNMQQFPNLIPNVRDEFRKVLRYSDIVGWQEVGNATYVKALGSVAGYIHKFQGPIKSGHFVETPLSVRKSKKVAVVSSGEIQWKEKSTTSSSMVNRFASKNVLDMKGKPVDVYSAHFPSEAWNHNGTATPPRPDKGQAKRQPQRQKDWAAAEEAIKNDLDKSGAGAAIIFTDQNRRKVSMFGKTYKGRRVQAVHNSLDWIYLIDGKNVKWELVGPKNLIKTKSDHPAVAQRVRLVSK